MMPSDLSKSERKGDWFTTFTGVHFYPLDPRPEEISIRDIAHALSFVCRYGGHCVQFYSVAEHSVRVARLLGGDVRHAMLGLIHDAAEAYIGDMVRPLKIHQPAFRGCESEIMAAIYKSLIIPPPNQLEHSIVKEADDTLLVTEARDLLRDSSWISDFDVHPLATKVEPWSAKTAERVFLETYIGLSK